MKLACIGVGDRSQPIVDALGQRDDVVGFFVSNRGIRASRPKTVSESNTFVESGDSDHLLDVVTDEVIYALHEENPDAVFFVCDFTEDVTTAFAPLLTPRLKHVGARFLYSLAVVDGSRQQEETHGVVYEMSSTMDATVFYDVGQWDNRHGVDGDINVARRIDDLYEYGLADDQGLQDIAWVGKAGGVLLGREEMDVSRETTMFSDEMVSVLPTVGDAAVAAVMGPLTAPADIARSRRALVIVRGPDAAVTDERLYEAGERVAEALEITEVRVGFVEADNDEDASVTVAITADASGRPIADEAVQTEDIAEAETDVGVERTSSE